MVTTILNAFAEMFDLPVLDWIAANLRCAFLDFVMPYITMLGDAGIFWIVLAVLFLIFPRTRKMGLGMAFALIMGLVVCNMTLKPLVQRIRPYDYQEQVFHTVIPLLIEKQHDFSFPSGHTIASFEAATVILIYNKKLGIPAMLLAALIAFSRLYLYVHYPTDVIASIILGVIFACIAVALANLIYKKVPVKKGRFER